MRATHHFGDWELYMWQKDPDYRGLFVFAAIIC
jgi:hypothetical protein